MRKLVFKQACFLRSALDAKEFPSLKCPNGKPMPEIALLGRSNAGKSSFLNALFQSKSLAKTSSTPGKTQRINFFLADDSFLVVDLPGYGYAKAPKCEVASWSRAIDEYLNHRPSLRALVLILDIRRDPSKEDLAMATWALAKEIPLIAIFTKRDKLSNEQAERAVQTHLANMAKGSLAGFIAISNSNFYERPQFIQMMNQEITWD